MRWPQLSNNPKITTANSNTRMANCARSQTRNTEQRMANRFVRSDKTEGEKSKGSAIIGILRRCEHAKMKTYTANKQTKNERKTIDSSQTASRMTHQHRRLPTPRIFVRRKQYLQFCHQVHEWDFEVNWLNCHGPLARARARGLIDLLHRKFAVRVIGKVNAKMHRKEESIKMAIYKMNSESIM